MSISKTRGFLYKLARLLGDWQAIQVEAAEKSQKGLEGEPQVRLQAECSENSSSKEKYFCT